MKDRYQELDFTEDDYELETTTFETMRYLAEQYGYDEHKIRKQLMDEYD